MALENLIPMGIVLVLIGIVLIFAGSLLGAKNVKYGFGGFIGPIPFGFGNDPRFLWVVIAISVVMLIIFLIPYIRGMI